MDSCLSLDKHSSFSLQVLPLVPSLLDSGSPATKLPRDPLSTPVPKDSCSSLEERDEEASLSASRFSLQVLPLLPFSLDDESPSTEPYGQSHAILSHRAPQDADANTIASLHEEIAPDGKTSAIKAEANAQVSCN